MAKKKATLEVEFERTDDTTKRLPTRAEMTQWMLAALSVPAAFCVRFVGLEEGQELNKTYRSKDYATNVLTFDYQHEPTAISSFVRRCWCAKPKNKTSRFVRTSRIFLCIRRCTHRVGITKPMTRPRRWKRASGKLCTRSAFRILIRTGHGDTDCHRYHHRVCHLWE